MFEYNYLFYQLCTYIVDHIKGLIYYLIKATLYIINKMLFGLINLS